jgi:hypothetical protein
MDRCAQIHETDSRKHINIGKSTHAQISSQQIITAVQINIFNTGQQAVEDHQALDQ